MRTQGLSYSRHIWQAWCLSTFQIAHSRELPQNLQKQSPVNYYSHINPLFTIIVHFSYRISAKHHKAISAPWFWNPLRGWKMSLLSRIALQGETVPTCRPLSGSRSYSSISVLSLGETIVWRWGGLRLQRATQDSSITIQHVCQTNCCKLNSICLQYWRHADYRALCTWNWKF